MEYKDEGYVPYFENDENEENGRGLLFKSN